EDDDVLAAQARDHLLDPRVHGPRRRAPPPPPRPPAPPRGGGRGGRGRGGVRGPRPPPLRLPPDRRWLGPAGPLLPGSAERDRRCGRSPCAHPTGRECPPPGSR